MLSRGRWHLFPTRRRLPTNRSQPSSVQRAGRIRRSPGTGRPPVGYLHDRHHGRPVRVRGAWTGAMGDEANPSGVVGADGVLSDFVLPVWLSASEGSASRSGFSWSGTASCPETVVVRVSSGTMRSWTRSMSTVSGGDVSTTAVSVARKRPPASNETTVARSPRCWRADRLPPPQERRPRCRHRIRRPPGYRGVVEADRPRACSHSSLPSLKSASKVRARRAMVIRSSRRIPSSRLRSSEAVVKFWEPT